MPRIPDAVESDWVAEQIERVRQAGSTDSPV